MKIILTLLAACLFNAAQAQLLIQTDIVPEVGENFASHVVTNAAALQPGSDGLAAAWDWSNALYATDTFNVKLCVPSGSTPHAALFPGANYAMKSYDNYDPLHVTYDYYFLDTNLHYYYLGTKGGVFTQVFSNPIEAFEFPFGYNNTSYDSYCYESSAVGFTFDYCGNTTLHFDGVGTLTLPYGSFNGVYRLRAERYAVDQASLSDTSRSTVYYWYKPGIHQPLATYEQFVGSDGTSFVSATVLSQFITGVNDVPEISSLRVYPNPFHQAVSITTSSASLVSVFTLEGKLVYESHATNEATVDLSMLPNGIYMLTASDGALKSRRIIVKQ